MTPDDLAAIRAREQAATRGPWEAVYDGDWQVEEVFGDDLPINPPQIAYEAACFHANTPANMRFIAHARTDVPALLAEVDRLQGLLHGGLRTPTDADPPGTLLGYVAFVKGEHRVPFPYRGEDDE